MERYCVLTLSKITWSTVVENLIYGYNGIVIDPGDEEEEFN